MVDSLTLFCPFEFYTTGLEEPVDKFHSLKWRRGWRVGFRSRSSVLFSRRVAWRRGEIHRNFLRPGHHRFLPSLCVPTSFPCASNHLLPALSHPSLFPILLGKLLRGASLFWPPYFTDTVSRLLSPPFARPFLPRSFALVTLRPSCNPKTLRLVWFSTWYQPLALSLPLFSLLFLSPTPRHVPPLYILRSPSARFRHPHDANTFHVRRCEFAR